jgi:hypothetical protein
MTPRQIQLKLNKLYKELYANLPKKKVTMYKQKVTIPFLISEIIELEIQLEAECNK